MDLAIGEFDEVGNTVKEFASEDAIVVVGTVIDPDLTEEIRVTVVATGLIDETAKQESSIKLVHKSVTADVDYDHLEKPTVIRHKRVEPRTLTSEPKKDVNLDYLDISSVPSSSGGLTN